MACCDVASGVRVPPLQDLTRAHQAFVEQLLCGGALLAAVDESTAPHAVSSLAGKAAGGLESLLHIRVDAAATHGSLFEAGLVTADRSEDVRGDGIARLAGG